jgi:hypothetical protein
MNMDVYGWTSLIRWISGAVFLALFVWAVIVVKRAIVGKGPWVHWGRYFHHRHY